MTIALADVVKTAALESVNVPFEWARLGVCCCSAVGLTFGLWPAMKASRLAPVDALGYE